jgi:hypothetical protein
LAELQLFRKRAAQVVAEATAQATAAGEQAVVRAYLRGVAAGQGDLERGGIRLDSPPQQAERATEALVRAQADQLAALGPQVVRQAADAYRDAVVRASGGVLSGATTRLQAAQQALDDLARRGITGFTDRAGRQWGLESYVDMATRTTTAQAAIHGHLDRLADADLYLVQVSDSAGECDRCRPWEGKVLAEGPVPAMMRNAVTGDMEPVQVDGTLGAAMAAGLFHPNCTHNVSAYIPGASVAGQAKADPARYKAMQEQRAMERRLREWKRRQAAAMTPEAKRKAAAKVREWQARIRQHVSRHDLPRKYNRESFDIGPRKIGPDSLDRAPLEAMDADLIDQQMRALMEAGDYGPRFERLAAELDRRDQLQQVLPSTPDPLAEQEALNRLLFGTSHPETRDLTAGRITQTAEQIEKQLRDEFDTWVHSQWLRAEADTRGRLLTKRAEFDGVDPTRLFDRQLSLKYASPELQEWFAQPGNARMSFPEFRAGRMDDKKAREARKRLKGHGYESEYG